MDFATELNALIDRFVTEQGEGDAGLALMVVRSEMRLKLDSLDEEAEGGKEESVEQSRAGTDDSGGGSAVDAVGALAGATLAAVAVAGDEPADGGNNDPRPDPLAEDPNGQPASEAPSGEATTADTASA